MSFLRQGRPPPDLTALAIDKLDQHFPGSTWPENRELVRLLTWLEAPDVVAKTMPLLESAPTQEEQFHYVEHSRRVRVGWTTDLRRRYFGWWTKPRDSLGRPPELIKWFSDVGRKYVDGAWLDKFLTEFRNDAVACLTEAERRELEPLLDVPLRRAQLVPTQQRAFVRTWTLDDLLPHLDTANSGRNLERGRQAFVDAQSLSCHRFGNDGGVTGPELTAAARKYDRRALLESILEPSKVINEQYRSSVVTLKDAEQVMGRVVNETATTLEIEVDPVSGARQNIAKAEIKEIAPAKLSAMPEGLVNTLTREEILDLLAYLETGAAP